MKFNMFSKNKESISSSDHIANKKNLAIYVNRNNSRNAIVENDMIKKSLNYTERYNMYKGFVHCKKINHTGNENCFNISYTSNIDPIKKKHMEDYHLSRVDYFDLADNSDLTQEDFPFGPNDHFCSNSTPIPQKHTYFNNNNSINTPILIKNFKYGHSMSNLK